MLPDINLNLNHITRKELYSRIRRQVSMMCNTMPRTSVMFQRKVSQMRFFLTIDIHKNRNHHHIIKQSFVKLNKAYITEHQRITSLQLSWEKLFLHPLFFRILFYLNGSDGAIHERYICIYTLWKDYLYETVYSQQSFSFLITVNVKGKTNLLFLFFILIIMKRHRVGLSFLYMQCRVYF